MEKQPPNADEIREELGLPKMPSLEEWIEGREPNMRAPLDWPALDNITPEFPPTEKQILDDDFLHTYRKGEE